MRRVENLLLLFLSAAPVLWSTAAAGSDLAPGGPVVVSEIQYHPPEELGPDELHEFVELTNQGGEAVDVSGWRLKDRSEENGFVVPAGTVIAPGGRLVLARNAAALRAAHGDSLPVVGDVGFALGNGGDTVRVFDAAGALADRVEFEDELPWPPGADGGGSTLERISLADDITDFTNFAASLPADPPGTPGAPNSRAGAIPERHDVVLNEIMYNPVREPSVEPLRHCVAEEFVEVFHRGSRAIDLSGWRLAGGIDFRFPTGTRLEPGAHLAVYRDEAGFRAKYGMGPDAVGPYSGDLEDGGETIYLLDHEDSIADRCRYDDVPPWPVNPDGISGSLELADPGSDNERGRAWRESATFLGTPGARNSAAERLEAAGSAGPQITGVSARPLGDPARLEVRSGDDVRVEARVMDADGISSVAVEYQVVAPGGYIVRDDPRFETDWTPVEMAVDPARGVHGATLPRFPHRTLVRYRIAARDASGGPGGGREERYPFPGDPEPNLAFFVHDGVREYVANRRSAFGPPGFVHPDLGRVPVYHVIAAAADIEALLYRRLPPEDTAYHHRVTFVHEGIVHDHAWIRLRGEPTSRYGSPRRSLKVRFNKGNRFRGRANDGTPYPTLRSKTNLMSEHVLRGDGGVLESLAWKIYRDADVLGVATTFVHLRVVRSAEEDDQFDGDFFGLFTDTQSLDTSALQDQGRPTDELSSLYKFEGFPVKQHPDCDDSMDDVQDFRIRSGRETARAYFEENLDVPRYLSFRVATELADNHDMDSLKNFFYFFDSGARRWEVAPWDLDHALGGGASGDEPLRSRVLPLFPLEYRNRFRFLWQVLYDEERLFSIIDEWSGLLGGLPDADQDRWDTEPREACPAWPATAGQCRTFARFGDRMRDLRSWIHIRSNAVKSMFLDESVPATPRNERPYPGGVPAPPVRLRSSPFMDPDGDAHAASRWLVIARDGDWTAPLWDTITQGDGLETSLPAGVAPGGAREYLFRVSHQDSTGRWGFLSEPTSFRVGALDGTAPPAPGRPRLERAGPRSVSLRWDPREDPQSGILGYQVIRDGAPLTRLPVPGTSQHDFGPTPGGRHAYRVIAVNRAGLSSAPSEPLEVDVPAGGPGGWEPIAGGWDYFYEARPGEDAHVDPRYEPAGGYLDGTWRGSSVNQWDGGRPGESGGAPGGVAVEIVPGAAEDGGSASVLSLEDPGDPASASPLPDNRRLLFLRPLGDEDPFARGVTLIARLRVNPSPRDLAGPVGQAPESPALRGQLGIGYRGATRRGRFSLWLDERGLGLLGGGSVPLSAERLVEFQSLWVTLEDAEEGKARVRVHGGGSAEPLIDSLIDLPTAGLESAYTGAYLEMGLANTPEAGAIQIDYFGYRAGVHAPVPEGSAAAGFLRGDANGDGALGVGDAILVLEYLFHRGEGIDCHDAADADDSGGVNVSDAVLVLRSLSGAQAALPAPFPECGEDGSADALPACPPAACGG